VFIVPRMQAKRIRKSLWRQLLPGALNIGHVYPAA